MPRMSLRVFIRGTLAGIALASAGGLIALADDGRPPSPTGAGHPPIATGFPATDLRPTDVRRAPIPTLTVEFTPIPISVRPPAPTKELVLFVGGYGSDADDGAFDQLKARFPADRYEVRRFGSDPRFAYDTYGSIDTSARALTEEIRTLGSDYAGVNLVSHSMGGVVVDRAFAGGLSAGDSVKTFIAIAAPHSGTDFARAPTRVLPMIEPVSNIVRAAAAMAARDPDSAAVRDLATARPIPPPVGVARLDITLATDGFVNEDDGRDPGVPLRIFLPANPAEVIDGHGGSLVNREIGDLVVETVRTHAVPPDNRNAVTKLLAPIIWDRETRFWRGILFAVTGLAIGLCVLRLVHPLGRVIGAINALCGRFLRPNGR